jgi:hypothetical protein
VIERQYVYYQEFDQTCIYLQRRIQFNQVTNLSNGKSLQQIILVY